MKTDPVQPLTRGPFTIHAAVGVSVTLGVIFTPESLARIRIPFALARPLSDRRGRHPNARRYAQPQLQPRGTSKGVRADRGILQAKAVTPNDH